MATEGTEERERIFATKSAKEREENVPVDALKSFGPDFLKEEHRIHRKTQENMEKRFFVARG